MTVPMMDGLAPGRIWLDYEFVYGQASTKALGPDVTDNWSTIAQHCHYVRYRAHDQHACVRLRE